MPGSAGPNLGLEYGYSPGDNGWGVGGFNPDMAQLDTLVMLTVINTTILTPPGSPSNGDRYIINGTGTGAWAGENHTVAVWVADDTSWTFYTPQDGWLAYDLHSAGEFRFNGTTWVAVAGGSETLEDLTDVQISGVTNGEVLTWNTSATKWENQAPSGGALSSLTDVELSGPTNGQILSYNTGATKWENTTNSVENLSDVDITSVANGQVLAWNSGASKWENTNASGGDTELSELTDVQVSGMTNGQLLTWNSTDSKWENEDPPSAGFTNSGVWLGTDAYSPGDVVTYGSSAYLCYESVSAPPSGAPTIDGSNGAHGVNTSGSVTLTTTQSDDIIVVCFSIGGGTVSSVTCSGVTGFAQRSSQSGNGGTIVMWTGNAASPLSGATINFSFSGDQFFQVAAFGVNGSTGFDSNVDLPLSGSSGTLSLNTSDANDFIIFLSGGGFGGGDATPGGFTPIYSGNFDGQAISVSYQRVNAIQTGTSFTVPTNYDLILDALAAPGSPTPNPTPAVDDEHWVGQGATPSVPTSAGTGLTTWLHQNGATVADTGAGILITGAAGSGANLSERTTTAPATPYTITARIAFCGAPTTFDHVNVGWYDGSAKLHVIDLVFNTSNYYQLEVTEWNSTTSFSAKSSGSGNPSAPPNPVWVQIGDNGTDISFSFSVDGENFVVLYSAAKSGAFLSGSYTDVVFGVNNQESSGSILGTLMSWTVGS